MAANPVFPRARAVAPALVVREEAGSTNAELAALAAAGAVPGTVVVTLAQTAGRGRLGRTWSAPPGTSLACSVLLAPRTPRDEPLEPARFGWLPIAAGVAMTDTVRELLPPGRDVGLKWPNDVLVADRKACGVLAELPPGGMGAIIGAGLNLTIPSGRLPVPEATSLTLEGADAAELADRALAGYLRRLGDLVDAYAAAGGDAGASGLRDAARDRCATLGRAVRVELPGAPPLVGTAVDLDESGRLLVSARPPAGDAPGPSTASPAPDRALTPVAAGDVTHLRYE